MYLDIHTHKNIKTESLAIININSINEVKAECIYSIGIHPWDIHKTDINTKLIEIKKAVTQKEIVAIGEGGLDRNIETSIEIQEDVFCKLSKIAESAKVPLIIHCVRAFSEMISLKKKLKPKQPWIIHGYNSNKIILEQLIKNEFYISFGEKLLNSQKLERILKFVTLDKLLLETDDSSCDIRKIYQKTASCLNINISELFESQSSFVELFSSSKK